MPLPILADDLRQFRKLKDLAEDAISQIKDNDLFQVLDAESNSIALIMKHIGGNLRSRWTNFLTTDGDKPDRKRDSEFLISEEDTRENIFKIWDQGWECAFNALESLRAEDMSRTVRVRGEPHSVPQAIQRNLVHTAYHVGQIVFLAKHFASDYWRTLSIPRGKSEEFVATMRQKWEKASSPDES